MKKQILMAFLSGTVLPLAVVFAAGRLRTDAPDPTDPTVQKLAAAEPTVASPEPASVTVLQEDGTTRQMAMEDYLTGVVLAEMPADFETEALKAQAVVARTYAGRRLEHRRHGEASVCTDPGCCQGYREPESYLASGGSGDAVEKIRSAVRETAGEVLTYEGELIDATYFSCSGGFTEDAVAVWGTDVPYLQAVESPGEEDAPRYRDERRLTAQELCRILNVEGTGPVETWFGIPTVTQGGGVDRMEICGRKFRGSELRKLLGLRSTAFEVKTEGDTVCFRTRGFGHRVGMSQYGAQAMAKEGRTFREILSHYYQGTVLENRN